MLQSKIENNPTKIKLFDKNEIRTRKYKKIFIYDIYEDISINELSLMPDKICGVYFIITNSESRYIGSSLSVKERILRHNSYIIKEGGIKTISIYSTDNLLDAQKLEEHLIKTIKSELNIRIPNIKDINDFDIIKVLRL